MAVGGLDAQAKSRAIRDLSRRTIWIGNGAAPTSAPSIAASAVSISTGGVASLLDDAADVVLLQSSIDRLVTIRQLAQAHLSRLRSDYRTVYIANLLGAAGGIIAGFGSLQAGLSSNLGTGLVLAARWNDLNCLARASERRDLARLSALTEELESEPAVIGQEETSEDAMVDFPELIDAAPTTDGV